MAAIKPAYLSSELSKAAVPYKGGTVLVHENDSSRKMFIICTGKARVFKKYLDSKVTLAILGEGEIFGELSFFDAEPRSASVEALTDLSAIVIDANEASKQIAGLPNWVVPIFRTAFRRLRHADQRLTVLQSASEYRKKTFKDDAIGSTIYGELTRVIKTLKILYAREAKDAAQVSSQKVLEELEHVLGTRSISLRVFWKTIKDHDFIDAGLEEQEHKLVLREARLTDFEAYLASEMQSNRHLILGHPALAILRRLISISHISPADEKNPAEIPLTVPLKELGLENLPLSKEGLVELLTYKIVDKNPEALIVNPKHLFRTFGYQEIIKVFDHTVASLD